MGRLVKPFLTIADEELIRLAFWPLAGTPSSQRGQRR
jgi:hypothetical protein